MSLEYTKYAFANVIIIVCVFVSAHTQHPNWPVIIARHRVCLWRFSHFVSFNKIKIGYNKSTLLRTKMKLKMRQWTLNDERSKKRMLRRETITTETIWKVVECRNYLIKHKQHTKCTLNSACIVVKLCSCMCSVKHGFVYSFSHFTLVIAVDTVAAVAAHSATHSTTHANLRKSHIQISDGKYSYR